jgi:hypothetical protein
MTLNTFNDRRVDNLKQRLCDEVVDDHGQPPEPGDVERVVAAKAELLLDAPVQEFVPCSSSTKPGTSCDSTVYGESFRRRRRPTPRWTRRSTARTRTTSSNQHSSVRPAVWTTPAGWPVRPDSRWCT